MARAKTRVYRNLILALFLRSRWRACAVWITYYISSVESRRDRDRIARRSGWPRARFHSAEQDAARDSTPIGQRNVHMPRDIMIQPRIYTRTHTYIYIYILSTAEEFHAYAHARVCITSCCVSCSVGNYLKASTNRVLCNLESKWNCVYSRVSRAVFLHEF